MADRVFLNLEEFIAFLPRAVEAEMAADVAARGTVAHVITEKVRRRIGQPDKLQPELAESTQAERVAKGFSPDETLLRTGALQESIAWDHESPRKTVVGSTSDYAPYHEFGGTGSRPGRPPKRSFLADTMSESDEEFFGVYVVDFKRLFDPL
jgi:phage gpG-like protein